MIDVQAGKAQVYTLVPRDDEVVAGDKIPGAGVATWCQPPPQSRYRCEVRVQPEPEGGYSVHVPELPGVVSEGDTLAEALQHIAEALRGALAVYLGDAGVIPWTPDTEDLPDSEQRFWIVVDV